MLKRYCKMFLLFVFLTGLTQAQERQEKRVLFEPKMLSEQEAGELGKLSADLVLTEMSGGRLIGNDANGAIIVEAPEESKLVEVSNSRLLRSFSNELPEQFSPINQLRLSYERDRKPTVEQLQALNLELIEDYQPGTFMIVKPIAAIDRNLIQALRDVPNVTYITPIKKIRVIDPKANDGLRLRARNLTSATPNDPRQSELWGMYNVRADEAWKCNIGGQTVVAVIDTGVDYTHEDLASNMWRNPGEVADGTDSDGNGIVDDIYGADFHNGNGDPMDDNSHGTHCAGTVAAVGNNGLGVVGVNWNTPVMGLKWIDGYGYGTSTDAIKCIDYAIGRGVKVLSNSWWHPHDPELKEAIIRARDAGALFIAAAGNFDLNNDDPTNYYRYPSSYGVDNIISVMAIDFTETKAYFSSYGANSVHIAAPGVDVLSSVLNNRYDYFDGTSMATPHVAGAAALIWNSPDFAAASWSEVKSLILDNARPLDSLAGRCLTGGTLDISFLGKGCGSNNPGQTCCTKVAHGEVYSGTLVSNRTSIASTKITLDQDSIVHITANCSARSGDEEGTIFFDNGFYDNDVPTDPIEDIMWSQSMRFVSLPSHQWTNFGSSAAILLPKGTHTIYWKVWVYGESMTLDFGTMLVQAFPIGSDSLTARVTSESQPPTINSGERASQLKNKRTSSSVDDPRKWEAADALLRVISNRQEPTKLRISAIQSAVLVSQQNDRFIVELIHALAKIIVDSEDALDVRTEAIQTTIKLYSGS